MSRYIIAAITPLFNTVSAALSSNASHRGWGDQIEWHSFPDALIKAEQENKHLMVIVHLMTCPACIRKKTWFSRNDTIADLSQHFVMVNVEPHEIPRSLAKDLAPDGHYVPRILFLTPKGRMLYGMRTSNRDYGYVYMSAAQLIDNMKRLVLR